MSWDAYVTSLVDGSNGNITKGAIIGLDGGVWTSTTGEKALKVTADEARVIASYMSTRKAAKVYEYCSQNGICVEGHKFMFIRDVYDDGRLILGKQSGHGAITLQITNLACVIAFTPNDKEQRAATSSVNGIVNYLMQANY